MWFQRQLIIPSSRSSNRTTREGILLKAKRHLADEADNENIRQECFELRKFNGWLSNVINQNKPIEGNYMSNVIELRWKRAKWKVPGKVKSQRNWILEKILMYYREDKLERQVYLNRSKIFWKRRPFEKITDKQLRNLLPLIGATYITHKLMFFFFQIKIWCLLFQIPLLAYLRCV